MRYIRAMKGDEESWLSEHRSEVADKIEEGYAAAQRGELLDLDQVRKRLEERKRVWFRKRAKNNPTENE